MRIVALIDKSQTFDKAGFPIPGTCIVGVVMHCIIVEIMELGRPVSMRVSWIKSQRRRSKAFSRSILIVKYEYKFSIVGLSIILKLILNKPRNPVVN